MTLCELSSEYYHSAAMLAERIEGKHAALERSGLGLAEKKKIYQEINILEEIYRDTKTTAIYLEKYYSI